MLLSHTFYRSKPCCGYAVNKVLQQALDSVQGLQELTSEYEMEVWVDSVYTQVHFCSTVFSVLLSSMQFLGKQIVTPASMPYTELIQIVCLGISHYQLTPALPTDHIRSYHELPSVSLQNGTVYLLAPFTGEGN